jgi:hypothetical protein
MVPDPFTGRMTNWCTSIYADAPICSTVAIYIRNSFLKVSDQRQYEPQNWVDTRHERHGYFRNERPTFDRRTAADDPGFRQTDFLNYNINRHNIWRNWVDEAGEPVPYADREVRPIVWYSTQELPAHLVKPSYELVSEWNRVLMGTVRTLRGEESAQYPEVQCQTEDPDGYCFCNENPQAPGEILNRTCPGRYDPFMTPEEHTAAGATSPYDCWVEVPEGAEPNMADPTVGQSVTRESFHGWFDAEMRGSECVNVLRMNTCNYAAVAANGGTNAGLECQERGDMRFKFLSYVNQPGTAFLGVATLRGDPVTGEILVGDANIGGPALDGYRTFALQTYDLVNGSTSDFEILTGEDVRTYLESLDNVQLPAPPRVDFNVAIREQTAMPQSMRRSIDSQMQRFMHRAERLKGAEGRANTFVERSQALAGSDFEKRLMDNVESLVMAGIQQRPQGMTGQDLTDDVLNKISPFRNNVHNMLAEANEVRTKYSKANMLLPNEYTDASVMDYVQRHADWPRARLEFTLDRVLYYETQLHEMGHCLGLRHQFGASADVHNYFDGYYQVDAQIPLPDPRDFDMDGTSGLSADEQVAFEDAYEEAKEARELAGIDRFQNSSVMEYTAQWYQRTLSRAGRYDDAAISFGYGDLVEVYDNTVDPSGNGRAPLSVDDIDPTNTGRAWMKYYQGGEVCEVGNDASCPYAAGGMRSAELTGTNMEAGLTQRCLSNPQADGPGPQPDGLCSNFDDDIQQLAADGDNTRWMPVNYRFCTDDRVGTIGWCHRFDEGDSYREIVRNVAEQYERQYLFTNFRRYERDFGIGGYLQRLMGRQFNILQAVFQNLLFRYAEDEEFREDTGQFGFYDQFLASTDVLNFYGRLMAQPSIGAYRWNPAWERYQSVSSDPELPGAQLSVPIGLGRYFSSRYQRGLTGIQRIERIGTFYEKWTAMQLMTQRGGPAYNRDVPYFVNYYDLFPVEMQQIFQGMVQDRPEEYMPRIECGSGSFPNCDDPQIVYMDFYRGDCSQDETCRPDPVEETYAGMPVVDGGGSSLLQNLAAQLGLIHLPVFFDTTFQNQLFICVEGQGDCHSPSPDATQGEDYVRYTSTRFNKTFLAWQVEPTVSVPNASSIGFDMVQEAKDTAFILQALRTYRGDFGGPPEQVDNLSDDQRNGLADLGYTIPGTGGDTRTVEQEVDRLDARLRELESFFFQMIQLERELGIANYLRY